MPETRSNPRSDQNTPFHRLGGEVVIRRIVDHFYDVMEQDPAAAGIRAMHAADLSVMRSKLADWMIGALGGPPLYAQRPDKGCMVSVHKGYPIGAAERDQWMACLRKAFDKAGVSDEMRHMLDTPFHDMADRLRSQ
ncbi:MAG: group II truncated hemoglobin [Caulobacterales bacterium]